MPKCSSGAEGQQDIQVIKEKERKKKGGLWFIHALIWLFVKEFAITKYDLNAAAVEVGGRNPKGITVSTACFLKLFCTTLSSAQAC